MSENQYRLLNSGELLQEGDEYQVSDKLGWLVVPRLASRRVPDEPIYRRLIAPPAWIAISERKPEFPCFMGFYDSDEWAGWYVKNAPAWESYATHWHPITVAEPPPPPMSKDEQEFERYWPTRDDSSSLYRIKDRHKQTYLAGFAAGRKQ